MNIYVTAIKTWGIDSQIDVAIGELAELIDALIKHRRGQCDGDKVRDEIADVQIMIEQLKIIYCQLSCDRITQYKVEKLKEKLTYPEKHRFK